MQLRHLLVAVAAIAVLAVGCGSDNPVEVSNDTTVATTSEPGTGVSTTPATVDSADDDPEPVASISLDTSSSVGVGNNRNVAAEFCEAGEVAFGGSPVSTTSANGSDIEAFANALHPVLVVADCEWPDGSSLRLFDRGTPDAAVTFFQEAARGSNVRNGTNIPVIPTAVGQQFYDSVSGDGVVGRWLVSTFLFTPDAQLAGGYTIETLLDQAMMTAQALNPIIVEPSAAGVYIEHDPDDLGGCHNPAGPGEGNAIGLIENIGLQSRSFEVEVTLTLDDGNTQVVTAVVRDVPPAGPNGATSPWFTDVYPTPSVIGCEVTKVTEIQ